jgi:hypothetical protein
MFVIASQSSTNLLSHASMPILKLLTTLMLALLFTHELDAMTQSEWRLLYVLRAMNDEDARWWFVMIHVPLFWALLALTHHGHARVQRLSRIGLAGFCVIHAFLHLRLSDDPLSSFNGALSWSLIYGAAVVGAMYLCFAWRAWTHGQR